MEAPGARSRRGRRSTATSTRTRAPTWPTCGSWTTPAARRRTCWRGWTSARRPMQRPRCATSRSCAGSRRWPRSTSARPRLKAHLRLALSGDNFRRRVKVEGRGRREPEWATLVDDAYVFAVPAPAAARYETIAAAREQLPAAARDGLPRPGRPRSRIEIQDAWVGVEERRRPRETAARGAGHASGGRAGPRDDPDPRPRRAAPALPRRSCSTSATPRFWRGVARGGAGRSRRRARRGAARWPGRFLGRGRALPRRRPTARSRENLRLDVCGRHRVLRMRIRNRDDAPLLGVAGAP